MAGINKVTLIGNLGSKPELRTANNGNMWTAISLATSESWVDKQSGDRREKTEWHKVVIWGKLAEIASKFCDKGTKVYLEGKLETRSWDDQKTGEKRYTTEIILSGFGAVFQILDKKDINNSGAEDSISSDQSVITQIKVPVPTAPSSVDNGGFGDDIPF